MTFDDIPDWNLNIHLILGSRYTYVIDTGLGDKSMEPVMQYLQPGKPAVAVNTHYHWDHVWGNGVFKDGLIVSHRLCLARLEEVWDEALRENRGYMAGNVSKCLPNLVFDGSLYFPEDGILLLHTPGHTIDSISVIDERDGVINAGDNIGDDMDHIVPELDCSREVYAATLKAYIKAGADTCVSGHNDVLASDIFVQILKKLDV